jgi:hypothetical protein
VLAKTFEPKTEEVTKGRRKLENELHEFYALSNIIRNIKSRRMGWARHVARARVYVHVCVMCVYMCVCVCYVCVCVCVCVCVKRNTYRVLNCET